MRQPLTIEWAGNTLTFDWRECPCGLVGEVLQWMIDNEESVVRVLNGFSGCPIDLRTLHNIYRRDRFVDCGHVKFSAVLTDAGLMKAKLIWL
jgi:hypothetical protein